jgi:uncharacterized protein (DUF952 family)
MICHITTRTAWEAASDSGQFLSPEFALDGFIHSSTPEQILLVAKAFFAGRRGLVMLVVDAARLRSSIQWEAPDSDVRLPNFMRDAVFPHVYGPINTDSVVRMVDLVPNETGNFLFPQPA